MTNSPVSAGAGSLLRGLREQRRISQLELSMRVGVSQRHLSCVETGRAGASKEMLLALLHALDAPLPMRNETLLAAGFAPAYANRPLQHVDMEPVRRAISHLLAAHDPAPAMVLDGMWNVIQANLGTRTLLRLLAPDSTVPNGSFNLLRAMMMPGPMRQAVVNADEVRAATWHRALREAVYAPDFRALVEELRPHAPRHMAAETSTSAPLLFAHMRSSAGDLRFFSTFTTFGTPLDVSIDSLRVEHLFPADDATRQALAAAAA